jgi:hypothetical protein
MPTTRFRDQLRRLYRGHRSGRLKSRIGLRQPLPEHGAQHRNPRGIVTRFCHAFAQFGALAAPELIEVHRGAGNLAGGHAEQRRGRAGAQRDRQPLDPAAQPHQRRRGRSADCFNGLPGAVARRGRIAKVENQPHRAVGQHALEHFAPVRQRFAIEQDVRDVRAQRRCNREGLQ